MIITITLALTQTELFRWRCLKECNFCIFISVFFSFSLSLSLSVSLSMYSSVSSSLLPLLSQSCLGGNGSGSARAITGNCCQSETSCLMLWLWLYDYYYLARAITGDCCQSKIITGNRIVAKKKTGCLVVVTGNQLINVTCGNPLHGLLTPCLMVITGNH